MKKVIAFITIVCVTLAATAQSAFFRACEDMRGVETVYISKTMLHLVGMMNLDAGDVDLRGLVRKLDNIEIINADGNSARNLGEKARTEFKNYEKLMTVKDDDETVNILFKSISDKKNTFVIVANEPGEVSVIVLTGTLTVEDVVKATRGNDEHRHN